MAACGAVDDHCCYLGRHGVCTFLRDDGPDAARRFVCTIRERCGSFDAMHTDPVYVEQVRPILREIGVPVDCGDWPTPGERCGECEVVG